MSVAFAIAQLRHLYAQLGSDSVGDQRAAALGLLGPAIRDLEAIADAQREATDALREAQERVAQVNAALERVLLAVERVGLTHRWIDQAGSWSSTLPPEVVVLVQAHDSALAVSKGEARWQGRGPAEEAVPGTPGRVSVGTCPCGGELVRYTGARTPEAQCLKCKQWRWPEVSP